MVVSLVEAGERFPLLSCLPPLSLSLLSLCSLCLPLSIYLFPSLAVYAFSFLLYHPPISLSK